MGKKTKCSGGDCVTVETRQDGGVFLSTTRRPERVAEIDADEWAAHLADVKAGRYDGEVPDETRRVRAAFDTLTLASAAGATVVRIDDMRAVLSGQRRTAGHA